MRNEHGEHIGSYQFVTDVTERVCEQAKLAEAQEALRQGQELEAPGQLTGGVAHDFNNRLTVIKSSTDLLKRPNLTEQRLTRYVAAISETADRAAKLTGQLLAFARRQPLKPVVFDVNQAVNLLDHMIGTLTGSRIALTRAVPDAACFVHADALQFDAALVNMAVDARDAMNGEGRLVIKVSLAQGIPGTRSEAPLSWAAVSITDTATGIPADRIGHVFEPLFTIKRVGQGTGPGLSQVFGFAKQSGGEVTVDSVVGEATTFTLYLPRAIAAEIASGTTSDEPVEDGHGTRVLVGEDNQDVGSFVLLTLRQPGYRTPLVTDGQAALDELAISPGAHLSCSRTWSGCFAMRGAQATSIDECVFILRHNLHEMLWTIHNLRW